MYGTKSLRTAEGSQTLIHSFAKLDLERGEKSVVMRDKCKQTWILYVIKSLRTAEGSQILIHSFAKLDLERSEKSVGNARRVRAYLTAKAAMGNTPKSANKFSSYVGSGMPIATMAMIPPMNNPPK